MSGATQAVAAPPRFEPALMRRKLTGTIFYGACIAAVALLLVTLVALLVDVLIRAAPWLDVQFLTSPTSSRPERAGILAAMVGTVEVGVIVGLVTFPIGVGAAIYLAEYASDSRLNRLLQTNISNLAGVPSIIYGILGLALFVRALALGPTVLAAALTLSLVILPVVIIASLEALKAVPNAQREGAYALGATRWQVVRRSVLPAAAPGIMTGIILAMARAVGEAAPLILIGAFTFVTAIPNPVSGAYTVLPIQIFSWAIKPQDEFQGISAAAIVAMLGVMLILNALAIVLRVRLSRHIQW